MAPKTRGSRRTVPLTPATTALLRDYLAMHPRRDEPTAPLFPNVHLRPVRPAGLADPLTINQALPGVESGIRAKARRQANALADLSTAEAGERLVLDWAAPNRHATFYKAVFRPAVMRANRLARRATATWPPLPAQLKFHALRHTYAAPLHRGGTATAGGRAVYGPREGHDDDGRLRAPVRRRLSGAMAALGAMEAEPNYGPNVVPLWARGCMRRFFSTRFWPLLVM